MSALSSPAPAPVHQPGKPVIVLKPEPPNKNRKWLILGAVLLIAIGAFAAYQVFAKQTQTVAGPAVRTAKAFVGPLAVTLRMTGQTSARNFANVITPRLTGPEARASLTLLQVAKSGTQVRKGDLLAQIDAQSIQDHLDDLYDTVAAAQNDIRKRKAEQSVESESLQQTLLVAKSSFDKARLDHQAAEVRTPIERELLKLSMDEGESRYKQQLGDVDQRRRSQASEMRILEITLDRHQRRVKRHEHDLTVFTIKSPMDGLVVMNTVWRGGEMAQLQQGDIVSPGMPILKVVDLSSMQVEGSINQSDSDALRISRPAQIGLDAFKDLHFGGKVNSIGALAAGGWRSSNWIRTVPVKIAIEGADARLIPDLSAHCDVLLETVPNQLQVALAGVHEEGGKATVMVRDGDSWTERAVTLGKRNNTSVAIASGLAAGDEIRVN